MVKLAVAVALLLALAFQADSIPLLQQDIEPIGGFLMYRVQNGVIEYLLLKKAKEDDWSPPKGNLEDRESQIDTAIRETNEETGWPVVTKYDVFIQYKIYFEYETKKDVLKQVHLWPAKVIDPNEPIELSEEHSEYAWLPYQNASTRIKSQYRDGLAIGDNIVRAHERLSNEYKI